MFSQSVRIATRRSPLALWQAEFVRSRLLQAHPNLQVELVQMVTQGDKILDAPLAKIGGKGLFVKELEQSLLEGRADIAVHSMKDVPVALPPGLQLAVILAREEVRDAFVSLKYPSFESLPPGACLGTSSLRRQAQLSASRPDLEIHSLRGNVGTRLKKLASGDFDAIILAAAGLIRLGEAARISQQLPTSLSLPAIGQGAIGIESRENDNEIQSIISVLDDPDTHICVTAERALNQRLEGGCQVPIAGYATLADGCLSLRGLVGRPDGSEIIRGERSGAAAEAETIGFALADELLSRGAKAILREIDAI